MKKKLRRFIVVTCLLILVSVVFIWLVGNKRIATLPHVSDPDWSQDYIISPPLYTHIYDYNMAKTGNLHMVWVERDDKMGISQLKYTSVNSDGDTINEERAITDNKRIKEVGLAVSDKMIHIFWVGKSYSKKFDLFYIRLDLKGRLIKQKRLLVDYFDNVSDFDVARSEEGDFMLVWSDKIGGVRQIERLWVSSKGEINNQPTRVTTADNNSLRPKIIVDDKGRYHLTWREGYNFYYKSFTKRENVVSRMVIDQVGENLISMIVKGDKLYLAWNKRISLAQRTDVSTVLEKMFSNYELYGTVIDLNNLDKFTVKRLTRKNGLSVNQTLTVDDNGDINLVYIDTYQKYMGLTHKVYTDNFQQVKKEARRIYPNQVVGSSPHLFIGPALELHLVWLESDLEVGYLHYANTLSPARISLLELMGINKNDIGMSSFMKLIYVLTIPIFNLIYLLHIFIIFILTLIIVNLKKIFIKRTKLFKITKNPYISPAIIFLLHILIYFVAGRKNWFFMQYVPSLSQIFFILTLSTIATIAYIGWNRFECEETVCQASLLALIWFYWTNVINLIFYLPFINY